MMMLPIPYRFINREDIDFSTAESMPAMQEWDLQEDARAVLEYPTM